MLSQSFMTATDASTLAGGRTVCSPHGVAFRASYTSPSGVNGRTAPASLKTPYGVVPHDARRATWHETAAQALAALGKL